MQNPIVGIALLSALLPLAGSLIAGLLGKIVGTKLTHRIAVGLVGASFFLACYLFYVIVVQGEPAAQASLYTWATAGTINLDIGLLVDRLSVTMMFIVLFVSLMVHIYTIGYMAGDPGYQRFFSYVSLFTFAMLMLVLGDNLLLMFFGWEGVGLVSYLLIGFWFERESANLGSLKAFLVNRIGDIGFLLAIGLVLLYFDSITYSVMFQKVQANVGKTMAVLPGCNVDVLTMIAALLFIGAMGKSAQVPFHIWLPESMEGPTPISALIHAATMVTAGIYMVARMSPIFEYAPDVLNGIMIIGGTGALFLGLIAITQNDIKRVIAYSTLSQLGYMVVALGASAYDAAIFHLVTHAFFKALLFLAAGSVIHALHHEQDMRKMGGLAAYLPVTYLTFLAGSLALCAIPPFSGFYSKEVIIEAAHLSHLPGAAYAHFCVLAGTFVTAVYTFRMLFMTFHTQARMDNKVKSHIHESPWVIWLPLVLLAIPSVFAGQFLIDPMLYSANKILGNTIFVLPEHNVLGHLAAEHEGAVLMALKAGGTLPFWLVIAGIFTAWLFIAKRPAWANLLKNTFPLIYNILANKYWIDDVGEKVFVQGTKDVGHLFYDVSDVKVIDGLGVNGSGRIIRFAAQAARFLQTGYIFHYAFAMVLGLAAFLVWYLRGF